MASPQDLWVFGYGSLMWRPGFIYRERQCALVRGYHRSLCVYSHVHRGTRDRPGLVFGLDRGGSCKGLAFRVAPENAAATIGYLRQREQVTLVYRETRLRARLVDGREVVALCYVADRSHPQYAGRLEPSEQARLVAQGVGVSGGNSDYIKATHAHFIELAIRDQRLEWLSRRLD